MTKSTSRRTQCMGCGETYNTRKGHICNPAKTKQLGTNYSEPQKAKAGKLMFGRSKRS